MENSISEEFKEIFLDEDKSIETLAKFLKYSIATLVYGTNKNDFKKCICTLSPGLINLYTKKLGTPDKQISKISEVKYNKSSSKIIVFDLAEGKKAIINLKNKKWGIASHLALSEENIEQLTEVIKRIWPKVTTAFQKEKGKKL